MILLHASFRDANLESEKKGRSLIFFGRNMIDERTRAENPNLKCEGREHFFTYEMITFINF